MEVRRTREPALAALLALVVGVHVGCDEIVDVVPGPAVAVELSPSGAAITGVGSTTRITVEARNTEGRVIASPHATFTSLNPAVATIGPSGQATAVASGQATIAAEVDDVVGYALLTVSVPGAGPVRTWSFDGIPGILPTGSPRRRASVSSHPISR